MRLLDLATRAFGAGPIDLVVDDASQFWHEWRESFRTLSPMVGPRGLYAIEDRGRAHWPGDYWQVERSGDYFRDKPPLPNLLVEIMLLAASAPELVSQVTVNGTVARVERGPRVVAAGFDPAERVRNRGIRLRRSVTLVRSGCRRAACSSPRRRT